MNALTKIRHNRHLFFLIACSLGLMTFLFVTNPQTSSVGILIVPVILFFLIVFCAAHLLINLLGVAKTQPRKKRIITITAAGLITTIMILQSTGGISVTDVILLILIIVMAAIYIEKF